MYMRACVRACVHACAHTHILYLLHIMFGFSGERLWLLSRALRRSGSWSWCRQQLYILNLNRLSGMLACIP